MLLFKCNEMITRLIYTVSLEVSWNISFVVVEFTVRSMPIAQNRSRAYCLFKFLEYDQELASEMPRISHTMLFWIEAVSPVGSVSSADMRAKVHLKHMQHRDRRVRSMRGAGVIHTHRTELMYTQDGERVLYVYMCMVWQIRGPPYVLFCSSSFHCGKYEVFWFSSSIYVPLSRLSAFCVYWNVKKLQTRKVAIEKNCTTLKFFTSCSFSWSCLFM